MSRTDLVSLVSKLARSPVGKYNAILTSRTMWFGKIINYFLPQSGVSVRSTIDKIQSLINKDPSVLEQPRFITDAIQVTNKLDAHVYVFFPYSEKEEFLSLVRLLEHCILTCVSNDQIKNPKVIQSIQSRLAPENILSYLKIANSSRNIPLATACCIYIEKNSKTSELINKNPEKIILLLNAGCLAKNDLFIQKILEIIYLNNFEIFKTKLTPALGYLLNKEEFSNQILLVGDLQNPQEILVNREILSQRNRYFHALFQTTFLEGSQTTITLKDQDHTKLQSIDYEGFLYLLHYIYTGDADVPLDLCLKVSHLADLYLEPDLKKICDKKKWDQATLALKNKNLTGKFQNSRYEEFFCLVHEIYKIDTIITLNDLHVEKLQNMDYQAILYLLHYIYTNDEDVPLALCSDVIRLADNYLEPDLKKACLKKT